MLFGANLFPQAKVLPMARGKVYSRDPTCHPIIVIYIYIYIMQVYRLYHKYLVCISINLYIDAYMLHTCYEYECATNPHTPTLFPPSIVPKSFQRICPDRVHIAFRIPFVHTPYTFVITNAFKSIGLYVNEMPPSKSTFLMVVKFGWRVERQLYSRRWNVAYHDVARIYSRTPRQRCQMLCNEAYERPCEVSGYIYNMGL